MQLRRGFQLKVLTDGKIALPETYQGGLGGTIIELLKPVLAKKEKGDNHFLDDLSPSADWAGTIYRSFGTIYGRSHIRFIKFISIF